MGDVSSHVDGEYSSVEIVRIALPASDRARALEIMSSAGDEGAVRRALLKWLLPRANSLRARLLVQDFLPGTLPSSEDLLASIRASHDIRPASVGETLPTTAYRHAAELQNEGFVILTVVALTSLTASRTPKRVERIIKRLIRDTCGDDPTYSTITLFPLSQEGAFTSAQIDLLLASTPGA